MSYKTIIVQVDSSRHLEKRVKAAAAIALAQDSLLVGMATIGMARSLVEMSGSHSRDPVAASHLKIQHEQARRTLRKFEAFAGHLEVKAFEGRLVDDDAAGGISRAARFCDLVVVGQPDPDEPAYDMMANFPEQAILAYQVPTLIVPYAKQDDDIGSKVLIAWNGSEEATRAVHDAIPILQRAKEVRVATIRPVSHLKDQDAIDADELAAYLARHGIHADPVAQTAKGDAGAALLSLAAELKANLLVMGCYGHSRFREMVLGGATRTVLLEATVPVLMSH